LSSSLPWGKQSLSPHAHIVQMLCLTWPSSNRVKNYGLKSLRPWDEIILSTLKLFLPGICSQKQ
jgi:hypothetical protein